VSAPTVLTKDRISAESTIPETYIKGRRYQECPRRGYSILTTEAGKRLIIQTRCKTKRCVPCSPAVKAHVALKAEIGVLIRPDSYFITLTLRKGTERPRDVVFVQRAWRGLQQRLKYETPWFQQTKWMKVVELTKAGQPHLHLIVTGVPGGNKAKCKGDRGDKQWVEQGCFQVGASCLHHDVAKAWARVTAKLGNESWVVDVSKVRRARAAGLYVSKYVTKGGDDERLAKLGFKRVWSTSKDFTPDLRLRLRGTVEKKWAKVEFWQPKREPINWLAFSDGDRDLEIVGHPLVMAKYEQREKERKIKWVKEIMNAGNKQTIVVKGDSGGQRSGNRVRPDAHRLEAEQRVAGIGDYRR